MSKKKAAKKFPTLDSILDSGTPVGIQAAREEWSEYILEDGTKLRVRPILAEVLRVKGQYTPDGNPLYLTKASVVLSAQSPKKLRKK